jgi:hypothetical protein
MAWDGLGGVIPAPGPDQSAGRVELKNVRRRRAALGFVAGETGFLILKRAGAVNDPDIILFIDIQADHIADHPVVRVGLGPERVHFELRHHGVRGGLRLRRTHMAQHGRRNNPHSGNQRDECRADKQITCANLSHAVLPKASFCREVTPVAGGSKRWSNPAASSLVSAGLKC